MSLSTQQIIRIVEALQHFDTPQQGQADGSRKAYTLAGTVRMAMAKNIARASEVINAYQKARNAIVYELAEGGSTVPPGKLAEFEKAHQALLDERHDVTFIRLKETLFNLDENQVPVWVLASLMPIVLDADNDTEPAAAA